MRGTVKCSNGVVTSCGVRLCDGKAWYGPVISSTVLFSAGKV